jgi:hypothetical protein
MSPDQLPDVSIAANIAPENPPTLSVPSRRLKAFAAALDRAGRQFMLLRGLGAQEKYRLLVEECPIHGPGCARVTYGVLRDHVRWSQADPAEVAAALIGTMLPPEQAQSATPRPAIAPSVNARP